MNFKVNKYLIFITHLEEIHLEIQLWRHIIAKFKKIMQFDFLD